MIKRVAFNLFFLIVCFPLFLKGNTDFFLKNSGQFLDDKGGSTEEVLFVYKGVDYDVYFQRDKISYVLKKTVIEAVTTGLRNTYAVEAYRFDLAFLSHENVQLESNLPIPINHHYINSKLGELVVKDGYKELLYSNLYNGIDVKFYFQRGELKYDFIVHPNADYKDIQMKYSGIESIINQSSTITIKTPLGDFEESTPEIYQEIENKKKLVRGSYLLDKDVVSFKLENYDISKSLIIDPWATFVGGVDIEEAYSSFADKQNNTYISGYTGSANFPTTVGVLQTIKQGLYDAFITKLDVTGNSLWSTFYGGTGDETVYSVVVDSDDHPYIVGYTTGNDLLVSSSGVFQSVNNGSYDVFILKLNGAGNFIWGTYFGGSGGDFALAADIDSDDNIVLAGYTSSNDMQILNSFQNTLSGSLYAFAAKFDSTGNLLWTTYCGGVNSEDVHALHVDDQDNVIVTGETYSPDFPTSAGAFQNTSIGSADIFLVKYDALGNRVFSTYFGGLNREDANGITSDDLNNIYLVGYSESNDFPILGSGIYQSVKNFDKDAFVAKFTPLGVPIKSTFIGGSAEDRFTSAAISSTNSLHVTGYTRSLDIPIIGTPYQGSNNGLSDGLYYKLDTALMPVYSTYIGGVSADYVHDLKVDANQLITFAGFTSSGDFPVTANVFQDTIAGQSDAFIFQVDSVFNFIVGLPDLFKRNDNVQVYPNPFDDQINLKINDYNNQSHYEVLLYNVLGKKVLSKTILKQELKLDMDEDLKPGNYFLALLKDKEVISRVKLINK